MHSEEDRIPINIEALIQNASIRRNASGITRRVFLTIFTKFIRAANSKNPLGVTKRQDDYPIIFIINFTINGESFQIVHMCILYLNI